jgi:uncharacterized membrane protein
MIDEAAEIQRRLAYLEAVRRVAMIPRQFGFVFCLIGAVLVIYASYRVPGGAFTPFGYTALAVIAVGWALFAYSIFARTRYVRAHPFEPQA